MSQAAQPDSSAPLSFTAISPERLSRAFLLTHDATGTPFEELIATGSAVFELIRHSDSIDVPLRQAFEQLEKQFALYAELAGE